MQGESKRLLSLDIEEGEQQQQQKQLQQQQLQQQQTARVSAGKAQSQKREWPSKLRSVFFLFIFLGTGVVIGLIGSSLFPLQTDMSSYFTVFAPSSSVVFDSMFPVQHGMEDEELLWRSSMVPRRLERPSQGKPKIAFMFLAVGPLPLASVWEAFFRGQEGLYSVYVHSHPNHKPEFSSDSVFYGRNIPSQPVVWGEVSIVDAERRLLANAAFGLFQRAIHPLVGELCASLQLHILLQLHNKLDKSFISAFDDPSPYGRGSTRYNWGMMPEVALEQFRKGGQWFELQRDLAIEVVSDVKYYPKFRDFCRPHCYIDEHYIQTMLFITNGEKLAGRGLTYTDWSRGGSHPATFVHKDITDEFLDRLRNDRGCVYNGQPGHVCWLVARKFSHSTLKPILDHALYN